MSTKKICLECGNVVDINSGLDICTYCIIGEPKKEPTILEKYKDGIYGDKSICVSGYKGIPIYARKYKDTNMIDLVAEFYSNDANINSLMINRELEDIDITLEDLKILIKKRLEEEKFN